MIKKYSNKNEITYANQDALYKTVTHIICGLYKIKEINRNNIYITYQLKQIVLNTKKGQEVINKLKEIGLTRKMLMNMGLFFFDSVLGDQFPE